MERKVLLVYSKKGSKMTKKRKSKRKPATFPNEDCIRLAALANVLLAWASDFVKQTRKVDVK
jgi:hypothetical protein